MEKEDTKGITVGKDENFSEWYNEVVQKAELADYSPIKGCMVIRPNGYFIWEQIQKFFDENIKKMKVRNAYFPLFIPESFFQKEAEHAEGFSPEVAWIEREGEGERLAVRPTSETIMYDMYSKWIRSYRDLPLRINQWANVVRWETKATRLFLRTREFLWQEGHCVYKTNESCDQETRAYLQEYKKVAEELLLVPVICGRKSDVEKFAGADITYSIEGIMPDGKALQMGTSHNLGQNFAKAFNINYVGKDEAEHYPFQNSWGISTRMIGGMIMVHGDDKGLVLPPKVAFTQVMIVPILFDKTKDAVLAKCEEIKNNFESDYRIDVDDRIGYSPGWKFNEWEVKGVPIRLELGPKDLEKNQVMLVRRDTGEKTPVNISELEETIPKVFEQMEKDMFEKAKKIMAEKELKADDWKEFLKGVEDRRLIRANFCSDGDCELAIKDETGLTTRCTPFDSEKPEGTCVKCGKPAKVSMFFAKQY